LKWGDFEKSVAETMQDLIFAFVVDPDDGLRKRGWLPHDKRVKDGGFMMRFAVGGQVMKNISSLEVDQACIGMGTYNSAPGV
jgi:hypothetical protein